MFYTDLTVTELKDLKGIGQPARNALAVAGFCHLEDLVGVSEAELKKLHGMGPKALRVLKAELASRGLGLAQGAE
ncbi:Helix-hairpin-helix domain containing protein [Fimbriimonadaceae bacterium]